MTHKPKYVILSTFLAGKISHCVTEMRQDELSPLRPVNNCVDAEMKVQDELSPLQPVKLEYRVANKKLWPDAAQPLRRSKRNQVYNSLLTIFNR